MYRSVTDVGEVREYLSGAKIIAFDFETAPDETYRAEERAALDAHKAHIVGVSFSVAEGDGIYVPVAHSCGNNADEAAVMALLAEFAANAGVIKVAHNLAFEAMFLYARGIVIQPPCYDTIAAAQMTLKSSTAFRGLSDSGLKTLATELIGDELPTFGEVTFGRAFDELDPREAETVRYACADSDYTLRLYHLFNDWFDRYLPRHRFIVEQIESPTAVYVGLMKYNGLLVDERLMREKQTEAEQRLATLREEIAFIIGDVNIGANASTAAFKKYLYNDLGLPVFKTTAKYQEAMDDEAMVLLAEWCAENRPDLVPLFHLVQDYRRWGKIKSTYIDGYLQHIDSITRHIYPQMLQLGAESGRFSCRKPNVQNQYAGKDLNTRDFIIAAEGFSLIELDYSQIEARLAAYLSRDEHLLDIYINDKDLHAMTTAAVFRIPFEEASDKHHPQYKSRRTVAKATFFGFMYGMYGKTLQRNLKMQAGIDVTVNEAKKFLENLKALYPTLTAWQKTTIAKARCNHYAETAFGRRRYVPNICSSDFIKAGNAERSALNHGVQGLAADLLKLSMGRLVDKLPPYIRPLFTVHDSLIFEVSDEKITEAIKLIKEAMEMPVPLEGFDVKIIAEVSIGKSYGKMEEIA